jgi:hypothetical protein
MGDENQVEPLLDQWAGKALRKEGKALALEPTAAADLQQLLRAQLPAPFFPALVDAFVHLALALEQQEGGAEIGQQLLVAITEVVAELPPDAAPEGSDGFQKERAKRPALDGEAAQPAAVKQRDDLWK